MAWLVFVILWLFLFGKVHLSLAASPKPGPQAVTSYGPGNFDFTMTTERQSRLKEIAAIAVKIETATQVPASLLVAQWALESKWGEKPTGNANYFGIKKAARHTKCCAATTHEVTKGVRGKFDLEFADYDSLEESCRDYAWLISNGTPYKLAWESYLRNRNPRQLLLGIAGTYASDPAYAKLVQQIAGQGDVVQAIAKARM